MSKITEITPIKDGMNKEEAREATQVFLSEILKNHRQIYHEDICKVQDMHVERSFKLVTMVDGSKWVEGAGGSEWDGRKDGGTFDQAKVGGGIQRVIGEDYLSKQLNILRIEKKTDWYTPEAAFLINDDKQNIKCTIAWHEGMKLLSIHSEDFVSYSKYAGKISFITTGMSIDELDGKPEGVDIIENETSWTAYDCSTNFRTTKEKNDDGTETIKRMILDTEYNSFEYAGESIFSKETIELLSGEVFEFAVSDLLG